jgi:hypothetical protein
MTQGERVYAGGVGKHRSNMDFEGFRKLSVALLENWLFYCETDPKLIRTELGHRLHGTKAGFSNKVLIRTVASEARSFATKAGL